MKQSVAIVFLLSLSNLSLCGSLTQRLADANKKITELKEGIKSGKKSYVCNSAWCSNCVCRSK